MPLRSPFEQGHAGAFHGDIGARAHGNADIGRRQRRRVVHAVTGHGHHAALLPEPLDDLALVLGQDLGLDVRDPELLRHGLGRGCVVARQHHDADAGFLEGGDRSRGRCLDRIGNGE
mgnify:CR=1 FL=1